MLRLSKALNAWGTAAFQETLKEEIERLDADVLPLQQGLSHGSFSDGKGLSVMIIAVSEGPQLIRAKTGIFYSAIIAGCSCADDPTPVDEQTEYCEVLLEIDKGSGETKVTLVQE